MRSFGAEDGETRTADGVADHRPSSLAKFIRKIAKRKMSRAYRMLQKNSWRAANVLIEIATDREVDPEIRRRAAMDALSYAWGKPVENVKMNVEVAPWQRIMATAIVNSVDGDEVQKALEAGQSDDIVDGEVVDVEPVEEPLSIYEEE